MHDQKVEKAAAEYLASVNGYEEGRWRHGEVIRHLVAFGEQVRRDALAPREPSPKLAEAERWIRTHAEGAMSPVVQAFTDAIARELDRLRAALAKSEDNAIHNANMAVEHAHERDDLKDEVARLRTLCWQAAKVCNESLTEYDGFEDRMREIVGQLESAAAGK